VPVDEWFRGPYSEFVREALVSHAAHLRGICDDAVMKWLVAEHIEGRTNNEKILWSLLNLEMFFRIYKPSGLDAIRDGSLARGLS
jgi:asparagine synthase (glutamine-hydrolysing)